MHQGWCQLISYTSSSQYTVTSVVIWNRDIFVNSVRSSLCYDAPLPVQGAPHCPLHYSPFCTFLIFSGLFRLFFQSSSCGVIVCYGGNLYRGAAATNLIIPTHWTTIIVLMTMMMTQKIIKMVMVMAMRRFSVVVWLPAINVQSFLLHCHSQIKLFQHFHFNKRIIQYSFDGSFSSLKKCIPLILLASYTN